MPKIDFATFCFSKDAHRLHAPGQFRRQVMSNCYQFNQLIVVYQKTQPANYPPLENLGIPIIKPMIVGDMHINKILKSFGVDIQKEQYQSPTDTHHQWKVHCVNHLCAASISEADYIVFADNDCWIKEQPCHIFPELKSWIEVGIEILENNQDCFIVSPGDGEGERRTQRMSQQMFMVRLEDFKNMDFNQPGFTRNVQDYDTMPEYHSMLEGRMHYHCVEKGLYRYVLEPKYRYWHHNRTNEQDLYQIDYSKY